MPAADDDWYDWRDRLQLADERFEEVNTLIERFVESRPYELVRKEQNEGNLQVLTFHVNIKQRIPRRISVLLAEILGHLRSSLDHILFALSDPLPGIQFPVFLDQTLFNRSGKGGGRYQMRGAPAEVQTILEQLQPYNRSTDPSRDPLWMVHNFARIDR